MILVFLCQYQPRTYSKFFFVSSISVSFYYAPICECYLFGLNGLGLIHCVQLVPSNASAAFYLFGIGKRVKWELLPWHVYAT